MSLSLGLGLGLSRQGGGGAAQPVEVVDLTTATSSLRFPENNHETSVAGSYAALYQNVTGFPSMFADVGTLFLIISIPIDRMHDNRAYHVMGTATSGGKRFRVRYFGTSYNNATLAGKIEVYAQDFASHSVTLYTPVITENRVLLAFRRRAAGAFSVDLFSLADGTKTAGDTATSASYVGTGFASTYFGIGIYYEGTTVPSAGSKSIPRSSGAWPGEIAAIGYVASDVDDATWQSIALGADIVTTLGASNVTYLREFDGTSDTFGPPAAATSDTTAACVAVDGDNLSPGSTLRRQDSTNYITADYIPTGYVFGAKKGNTSLAVALSGQAGGYTGNVEARFVALDGTVLKKWTTVGAISAGAWSGTLTIPLKWGILQVRPASDTDIIADMREIFGAGYKVGLMGQSQIALALASSATPPTLSAGAYGAISASSYNYYYQSAAINHMARVATESHGIGFAAIAEQWALYGTDIPLLIVDMARSGTSSLALVDDTDDSRKWSDLSDTLDYVGTDISAIVWQWGTAMNGKVGADVMNQIYSGDATLGTTDHYLTDGEIDAGFTFIMSPLSGHRQVDAGPFDVEQYGSIGTLRDQEIAWAAGEGFSVGPYLNDLHIGGNSGPHEDEDDKGVKLFGARLAMALARGMGHDTTENPSISGAAFSDGTKAAIVVSFDLPNGGSLTTDGADSAVTGFEISDDGGSTWSRSGFTAEISANTVILTKSSGAWTGGGSTNIRYDCGGPLSYGTSTDQTALLAGQLYETISTPDYMGLGMPVAGANTAIVVN